MELKDFLVSYWWIIYVLIGGGWGYFECKRSRYGKDIFMRTFFEQPMDGLIRWDQRDLGFYFILFLIFWPVFLIVFSLLYVIEFVQKIITAGLLFSFKENPPKRV